MAPALEGVIGASGDLGVGSLLGEADHRRTSRSSLALPSSTAANAAGASTTGSVTSPLAPDAPIAGPPGRVLAVEPVGANVRILRIGRPPDLDFRAGQYLRAGTKGTRQGKFSIASAPHESHVELCVELIPGGRLTPTLFRVQPGDQLLLGPRAKGGFQLDEAASTHLMVATATGIAPLRSMLRDARHRGLGGDFVVLHGASHADELPYHDELAALAAEDPSVRYVPTVSRPREARNRAWSGATGRVDPLASEVARSLHPSSTRVYACGNAGMISKVSADLGARGFDVRTEAYD